MQPLNKLLTSFTKPKTVGLVISEEIFPAHSIKTDIIIIFYLVCEAKDRAKAIP